MRHWRTAETAVRRFLHKTAQDHTAAYASKAALFLFISLFPFVMLLLTLIRYLPFTQEQLHGFLAELLPDELDHFLNEIVNELYGQSGTTLLPLTILSTLWAASKGFAALLRSYFCCFWSPCSACWCSATPWPMGSTSASRSFSASPGGY